MTALRYAFTFVAALLAFGCGQRKFTEPYKLAGNKSVDVKTLNDGQDAFMLYCYACHGEKGDGMGPASVGMRPPPRNFTRGLFKFAGVEAGKLPTDEALDRTIRRGLYGTPMLPWDVPVIERKDIIPYLKTLSPRWQSEEEYGTPIEISPDPWVGKSGPALERGKQVYHVAVGGAGCSGCHPAYATRAEISQMTQKATGEPVAEFAEGMYQSMLRESEYPLSYDDKGEMAKAYQILPVDFLTQKIKTAPPLGTVPTRDQCSPSHSAGTATASPASGPATAMSNSEFRSRVGARMLMMAPSVPNRNGGGTGMKNGSVTGAR